MCVPGSFDIIYPFRLGRTHFNINIIKYEFKCILSTNRWWHLIPYVRKHTQRHFSHVYTIFIQEDMTIIMISRLGWRPSLDFSNVRAPWGKFSLALYLKSISTFLASTIQILVLLPPNPQSNHISAALLCLTSNYA